MMTAEQESRLYLLSETLDVEIYVVGVGDKTFVPAQSSAPVSTSTKDGALSEWVIACLDGPEEVPWWTHTHPAMDAFFSVTDVRGAHNLWEAIRRPIQATVLGHKQARHSETIDAEWVSENPKPESPLAGYVLERPQFEWGDEDGWSFDLQTNTWRRAGSGETPSLAVSVVELVQQYGWQEVLEVVQMCAGMGDDSEVAPSRPEVRWGNYFNDGGVIVRRNR